MTSPSFYSFFDEFNKIADAARKEEAHPSALSGRAGVGLSAGGILGGQVAGGMLANRMDKTTRSDALKEGLLRQADELDAEVIDIPGMGRNAAHADMEDIKKLDPAMVEAELGPDVAKRIRESKRKSAVLMGDVPEHVMAHELGHAKNQRGAARFLQGRAYQLGRNPLMGAAAGGLTSFIPDDQDGVLGKVREHGAWAAPLAMSAPVLGAEALASIRGRRIMRNAGATQEQIREYTRQMLPAYGTYVGGAGLNVGAGLLGRAAVDTARE